MSNSSIALGLQVALEQAQPSIYPQIEAALRVSITSISMIVNGHTYKTVERPELHG